MMFYLYQAKKILISHQEKSMCFCRKSCSTVLCDYRTGTCGSEGVRFAARALGDAHHNPCLQRVSRTLPRSLPAPGKRFPASRHLAGG